MTERVLRQSLRNRLVHWTIAASCLFLIATGIMQMPVAKRYGLDVLLGAWAADYDFTLLLHVAVGALFTGVCVFHLAIHAMEGDYDIVPKKGDTRASWLVMKAMLSGKEEPPAAKYLPEQRLAWAAFVLAFLIVIVTGLFKVAKNFAGWDMPDPILTWIAMGHNLGLFLSIVLFMGHMAAFLFKPNRHLLPGMWSGKVDADYARHRHSLWTPEKD